MALALLEHNTSSGHMLHRAKELRQFTIDATDGEIGQVLDFYFDDERWTVRYIVVDAGAWFTATTFLISPAAIFSIDWRSRYINTSLTRDEVKNSPTIHSDMPLLRHTEVAFNDYYHYSYYWSGPNLWGLATTPGDLKNAGGNNLFQAALKHSSKESFLRSINEVSRYQIAAEDGDIGYIQDFIIDDETWAIRYLVVEIGDERLAKKVMLSPQWITDIGWSDRRVYLDLEAEEIRNSPAYDESAMIDRAYEQRLYNYYGRSHYWNN
jgi:sporulation protein YlmC with PRC-barrel domain